MLPCAPIDPDMSMMKLKLAASQTVLLNAGLLVWALIVRYVIVTSR